MTADLAASPLTPSDARRLTDKIKSAVEGTWQLIQQAYTTRAWDALGYQSWDDYCSREFGTSRLRLPREERQEVVASMRENGMSTRAIGSALGVSDGTVRTDLSGAQNYAPAAPAEVTGTDGKTYSPKAKVTDRTSSSRTIVHDLDTTTGELTEPAPEPEPNPIADARGQAYGSPAIAGGKAIAGIFANYRSLRHIGTSRLVSDLDDDNAAVARWIDWLDQIIPLLQDLRSRLARRSLRSIK